MMVRMVVLAVWLSLAGVAPSGRCSVKVAPRIAIAPVRFVRVKVQIEDRSGGTLTLDGPAGHETSSLIQAGVVTTWVEWKNVALIEPGEYEVRLLGRCTARDVVLVAGGDGF